jgi:hypothetical protein
MEKVLQAKQNLDSVCSELGVKDIKFTNLNKNANVIELAEHATIMLRDYQKFLAGDKTTGIKEIFTDIE